MLIAPISSTVHELQTHTVGGVVTPAQPIMNIVPKDQTLLLGARVERIACFHRDIGFAEEGRKVTVLKQPQGSSALNMSKSTAFRLPNTA